MTRGDPRRRGGRRRREDFGPPRAEPGASAEPPMIVEIQPVEEKEVLRECEPTLETENDDEQQVSGAELVESLREQVLRLQAEFDNYRKRQAREFHRLCTQGKRDLILEILSVLDNIDRGREHRDTGAPAEEILPGLFQTAEQLSAILAHEGLEQMQISPMDSFDPNLHEAVVAEDREDADRDVVLEVFRKGYTLDSDLLRPAMVKVGRAGKPAPPLEE